MLGSYLLAMGIVVFLMIFWYVVQTAWRKFFPELPGDEDALALRGDCHGCSLGGHCETKNSGKPDWDNSEECIYSETYSGKISED